MAVLKQKQLAVLKSKQLNVKMICVSLKQKARRLSYLDKALVEREIVTDAILPSLLVILVKRKPIDDKLVDLAQGELLEAALGYRHGYQCVVGEGRFLRFTGCWGPLEQALDGEGVWFGDCCSGHDKVLVQEVQR